MTPRGHASCRDEVGDPRGGVPSGCPTEGMLGVVVLVAAASPLDFLHVGVLVDDRHHVAHGLGVGLEHLPP